MIIPVYNLEAYLSEAVDSVLAQTFGDFEVILVDDDSSDGSRDIVASYRRKHPDCVHAVFLTHGGASAARNAGLAVATGEWVAFLDGDDIWRSDKLERQLGVASTDSMIDFIAATATVLGSDRFLHSELPDPENLFLNLLLHGCYFSLSSVLIRRDRFAEIRFDERLRGAQDLDVFLKLARHCTFRLLAEPLVEYRVRSGAISDPQGDRYLQLRHHLQLERREIRRLRLTSPDLHRRWRRQLSAMQKRLSHEAAWAALQSRTSTFHQRLHYSLVALVTAPGWKKNWRFLIQSLLPASILRRLSIRPLRRG